ncbi:MAG: hypothetical protein Q9225_007710 [Loekoesia sp. 1 TL-2023]
MSDGKLLFPRTLIGKVPPTENVYQGTDKDKRLLFRQNIYDEVVTKVTGYLTGSPLVALGLTEVCCRIGKGKVLWMDVGSNVPKLAKETAAPELVAKTVRAHSRMPDLLYIPYIWGARDQAHWAAMEHNNRLQTLNARAGALMLTDVVMPEMFQFDAYSDEHSGCKALLAIVPKAFIGWCWQFHEKAIALHTSGGSINDGGDAWYVVKERALVDYQVDNAEMVAMRLNEMYHAGVPRSLIKFEVLLKGIMQYHRYRLEMEDSRKGSRRRR